MKPKSANELQDRAHSIEAILRHLKKTARNGSGISLAVALLSAPAAASAWQMRLDGRLRAPGLHKPAAVETPAEFQVNTYTTAEQIRSSVAADSNGNFVVVWQSRGSVGADQDDFSIQAQRYSSSGNPVGDQFQVNVYSTGTQSTPVVAMDADGDFLVAWQSDGSSGSDQSGMSIQARRFSSGGTAGDEFQVNTSSSGDQQYPSAAMDADGDFVITWASSEASGPEIRARRFDNAGSAHGSDFIVNAYSTGTQFFPAAAMDSDGDFVITWASSGTPAGETDTAGLSIQAQRYNNGGIPQGAQFQVNAYTSDNQIYPAVSIDSDGDFVVVWQSDGSDGSDTSASSIQAQIFHADGTPRGDQFQVNEYTSSSQFNASVAMNADGDFIVTWDSFGSGGDDSELFSVQGRYFYRNGFSQHGEFQVNQYTTNSQNRPGVASDSTGDFVVVWESDGSTGSDDDLKSIQARKFEKPPLLIYLPVVLDG